MRKPPFGSHLSNFLLINGLIFSRLESGNRLHTTDSVDCENPLNFFFHIRTFAQQSKKAGVSRLAQLITFQLFCFCSHFHLKLHDFLVY